MRRFFGFVSFFFVATSLAGCSGNWDSIFRTTSSDRFDASFIDAKQRGVFVTRHYEETGNNRTMDIRACAEPSPDVMASVSASLSASGGLKGKAGANFAASLAGSAASIGLRTQSIQLMRDALYRICEAYAAGAISKFQMRSLQYRYQNMIIGLLAIEQLTGVVRAPAASIGGAATSAAGAGDPVALTKQLGVLADRRNILLSDLKEQKKAESTAKTELDNLTKLQPSAENGDAAATQPSGSASGNSGEIDSEGPSQQIKEARSKYQAAKKKKETTEKDLEDTEKSINLLRKAVEGLQNVSSTAQQTVNFVIPPETPEPLSAETAEVISGAVQGIVHYVIEQDNTTEACIEFIKDMLDKSKKDVDYDKKSALQALSVFCRIKLDDESQRMLLSEYGHSLLKELADIFTNRETQNKAIRALQSADATGKSLATTHSQLVDDIEQGELGRSKISYQILFRKHLINASNPRDLSRVEDFLNRIKQTIENQPD